MIRNEKNKNRRWGKRGKTGRDREYETNKRSAIRGRTKKGFRNPEHGGIEVRERTHAQRSGNTSSGGRTHPPIQPSQLLGKLLKPFVVVAPDGSVSCEAGGGNVPRIVPLEEVSQ